MLCAYFVKLYMMFHAANMFIFHWKCCMLFERNIKRSALKFSKYTQLLCYMNFIRRTLERFIHKFVIKLHYAVFGNTFRQLFSLYLFHMVCKVRESDLLPLILKFKALVLMVTLNNSVQQALKHKTALQKFSADLLTFC